MNSVAELAERDPFLRGLRSELLKALRQRARCCCPDLLAEFERAITGLEECIKARAEDALDEGTFVSFSNRCLI